MNRHIIISFVIAVVFIVGGIITYVKGDALLGGVFALGGLAFVARGALALRSARKD